MTPLNTVADRGKIESQNTNQCHKTQKSITNPKRNHKTQNRITQPYTESQNPKQNHKTSTGVTKPKRESQTQNRKSGIWENFVPGIRNSGLWNPEYR